MTNLPDNHERDTRMAEDYKSGYSLQELSDMYELSRQRVGVILKRTLKDEYVKSYKTSERHRELCNKRYREKQPAKPRLSLYDSFDADVQWEKLGVQF